MEKNLPKLVVALRHCSHSTGRKRFILFPPRVCCVCVFPMGHSGSLLYDTYQCPPSIQRNADFYSFLLIQGGTKTNWAIVSSASLFFLRRDNGTKKGLMWTFPLEWNLCCKLSKCVILSTGSTLANSTQRKRKKKLGGKFHSAQLRKQPNNNSTPLLGSLKRHLAVRKYNNNSNVFLFYFKILLFFFNFLQFSLSVNRRRLFSSFLQRVHTQKKGGK